MLKVKQWIPKLTLSNITQIAILIAVTVVLKKLVIATPIVQIGFDFIPLAITGMLFGPIWAGLTGVLADLIATGLFNSGQSFFLGYTLTAFMVGFIYGLFLYKNRSDLRQIFKAEIMETIFVYLFLGTMWIFIMQVGTKSSAFNQFSTIFMFRLVKNLITFPIHVLILYFVLPRISKARN